MNEFLLLAVVLIYLAISCKRTKNIAARAGDRIKLRELSLMAKKKLPTWFLHSHEVGEAII
jgi:hypothetical protein